MVKASNPIKISSSNLNPLQQRRLKSSLERVKDYLSIANDNLNHARISASGFSEKFDPIYKEIYEIETRVLKLRNKAGDLKIE